MKSVVALFIIIALGFAVGQTSAQLLSPYSAKEGMSTALKSADSSVNNPKVVGIMTLGDTTSALALPISVKFELATGKSEGWMYFIGGQSKKTAADTIIGVAVVKIIIIYQSVALDISSLGPLTAFFNIQAGLPNTWLDSGEMAAKIRGDAAYKSFAARYPEKKPLLVPLSISIFPQFFPSGTPLWQLTFGGSLIMPGTPGTLECEVHAVTGETKCQENTATSAEDISTDANFTLAPNPAADAVRFALPDALRGGVMSVAVINAVGQVVFSNSFETSAAESVVVPVETLSGGVYRLVCSANGRTAGATFVVAR